MAYPSLWIISILMLDSCIVTSAGVVRTLIWFGSYRGVVLICGVVWGVSDDSVASFFVVCVKGVVVGEGC
jgi:hypothetical protein